MQPSELRDQWNETVAAVELLGPVTNKLAAERSSQEWEGSWTTRAEIGRGSTAELLVTTFEWSISSTAAEVSTEVECTITAPGLEQLDARVLEALSMTIAAPALIPVARAHLLDMVMRLGLPAPGLGLIKLPSIQQVLEGKTPPAPASAPH